MPGEKLLVVCSFAKKPLTLKIPAGFDMSAAELILCNYDQPAAQLRPYECRVYRWHD